MLELLPPLSLITGTKLLVLDFETTNLDKGSPLNLDNKIVLAVWWLIEDGKVVKKHKWGNEYDMGELVEDCVRSDLIIAHNTKFEIGWLNRCGMDTSHSLFFCTMIADYVIAGNRAWKLDLNTCANRRSLGAKDNVVSGMIKGGVPTEEIPKGMLFKYCVQDVQLCYELFLLQREELTSAGLLPSAYTRFIVTPVLVDIESKGMHLDKQRVYEVFKEYDGKHREAERELSEFADGVNFNSPKQVAELLYERLGFSELKDRRGNTLRTAADGRKTDIETIVQLKANTKHQKQFLALLKKRNELETALSKSLRFFMAVVDETDDCVFNANLNQTITQTHRLSCTGKKVKFKAFKKLKGAQIQNIDRDFKRLFSARTPGWKIGEGDAAQLEFRVAVFLGQDEQGMKDIEDKIDVHSVTASVIYDKDFDWVVDNKKGLAADMRQESKSRTFKPLYGGESGTEAERKYYALFKEKYPGIVDAQEEWKTTVEKTKQLTTATGLIFYWPDTKWEGSAKRPYLKNTTSICNFPVQSLATADIVPIALVLCWYLMREMGLESFIINTIHDSIVAEVAPGEEEKYAKCIELSFTTGVLEYLKEVYQIDFNVPLETEIKIGEFWNE